LLRRTLNDRIGATGLSASLNVRLWGAALIAATVAWAIKLSLPGLHPIVAAAMILGPFGLVFMVLTFAFGVSEARHTIGRLADWKISRFKDL
jgi:hypothetical protein